MTAVNIPDVDAFRVADDKSASMTSLAALGIPCARVYTRDAAMSSFTERSTLTFVVKPNANVGSARGVRYVKTPRELDDAIDDCQARFGRPLIQEYVPGDPTEMKTVVLLYSKRSRLVAAFTTRKKRQWPPAGGLTVISESTDDKAIVEQVRPFFDHWHWNGAAEVELKRDCISGVTR
jgi:Predicted ATP-grasp enzyme